MTLLCSAEHRDIFTREEQRQIDELLAFMHQTLDPGMFENEDDDPEQPIADAAWETEE